MRFFIAVALLFAAPGLYAQPSMYHFTLEPSSTTAGQTANLRVDSDNGCYPANAFFVTRDGTTVNIKNTLSDTLPCEPQWQTPRLVSLGTFEPGTYQVTVETCVNAPSDPCNVWANLSLTVFGVSSRFTVPTMSQWGALGLVGTMLMCGLFARRRA